jgi:hypothetical protein
MVRNTPEWAATASGVAHLSRHRVRRNVAILAYHNIVPDEALPAGERSPQLSFSAFRAHLDHLQAHAER